MTNWVLFIGALLLASVLWGRSKPSFLWVLAALLIMVAGKAFSETGLGQWVASTLIGGPLSWFGSVSAWATVLMIFAVAYAIFDVAVDRKLDKGGAAALFVTPLLLLLVGGSFAAGVDGIYSAVQNGATGVISSVGG